MKSLTLFLLFVVIPAAFSQCESTISPTDKIADVQKKLDCLASENAKLKEQLEKNKSSKVPALTYIGANFDKSNSYYSAETCKNRAVASAVRRGGKVTAQSPDWIALEIGSTTALIDCRSFYSGFITAARPIDPTEQGSVNDFVTVLKAEIFP